MDDQTFLASLQQRFGTVGELPHPRQALADAVGQELAGEAKRPDQAEKVTR